MSTACEHKLKTESIRKLSNFSFQWRKTLCQNNLSNVAFFFYIQLHFSRPQGYGYNQLYVVTPKTISHGSPRKQMSNSFKFHKNYENTGKILKISYVRRHFLKFDINLFSRALIRNFLWRYYRYLIISIALEKCKKECNIV